MLSLLQVLTELSHYSVFSSLSEGVDHHELICQWWLRSLLITLSLKIDRLICQRQIFAVVHSHKFKHLDVDELYTLYQHSYKYNITYNNVRIFKCELWASHILTSEVNFSAVRLISEKLFSLLSRLQVSENTTIYHKRWRRRSERKRAHVNLQ